MKGSSRGKKFFDNSREDPLEKKFSRRELNEKDISKLKTLSNELKGRNVLVLNEDLEIIQNVPSSRLSSLATKDAFVLMTSNATSYVISGAEKLGSRAVAAKTFVKIPETNIELISL